MRILVMTLFFSALLSSFAYAESRTLFYIRKPVSPENLVQVQIPVDQNCKLGNVDFIWSMNNGESRKVPNSILRCNILKRLQPTEVKSTNKGACPKQLPPGAACYEKGITAAEIGYVDTGLRDSTLVVRSVKSASTGECKVAAFIDMGERAVQIKQINLNGRLISKGFSGATVGFSDVEIIGMNDAAAATWKCTHDCVRQIPVELSCSLGY